MRTMSREDPIIHLGAYGMPFSPGRFDSASTLQIYPCQTIFSFILPLDSFNAVILLLQDDLLFRGIYVY